MNPSVNSQSLPSTQSIKREFSKYGMIFRNLLLPHRNQLIVEFPTIVSQGYFTAHGTKIVTLAVTMLQRCIVSALALNTQGTCTDYNFLDAMYRQGIYTIHHTCTNMMRVYCMYAESLLVCTFVRHCARVIACSDCSA